jgi:hypothetical protein
MLPCVPVMRRYAAEIAALGDDEDIDRQPKQEDHHRNFLRAAPTCPQSRRPAEITSGIMTYRRPAPAAASPTS